VLTLVIAIGIGIGIGIVIGLSFGKSMTPRPLLYGGVADPARNSASFAVYASQRSGGVSDSPYSFWRERFSIDRIESSKDEITSRSRITILISPQKRVARSSH
jgi:hypothetical protein